MKFCVSFKTPDAMDELDPPPEEQAALLALSKKYVEYGEYVTLEFDTEAKTCNVMEV